jgi:uncharacterized protein
VTGGVLDFQFAVAGDNPENRQRNLFAADFRSDMPVLEFCRSTNGVLLFLRSVLCICVMAALSTNSFGDEPPGTVTIAVFGDSQAAGLARGLQRVLVDDRHYRVLNRTHPGVSLAHAESEWLPPLQRFVETKKADIAIVMYGGNDRIDMQDAAGRYLRFGTDAWRETYTERVERVLKILVTAGLKVTWCGNPIARSAKYSTDMEYINKLYETEAEHFGAQFLALWAAVVDDQGGYTAYGKDRDGVTERLRADDGIHFTAAGYELIAQRIIAALGATAANAK